MISISEMVDVISKIIDYIDNFIPDCKEKEYSVQKLKEAIFWLTYLDESDE